MHEAVLYTKLKNKIVKCHVCGWECVIAEGRRGFCQTRENRRGKLYSLIYGKIYSGIQIDPIEKKPMYHFYPGTQVASIGSFGCNFRCKQCLNWYTSYKYNFSSLSEEMNLTPKQFIFEVKRSGLPGVAFTYNEPTIWIEFVYDCAKLARKEGLYTVLVTNGFLTQSSLDYLGPYIQGYAIDFKGFSKESYQRQGDPIDFRKIIELTKRAQERWQMKVEITTLIIPGINDETPELEKMAEWIYQNLGGNTPWHLSQYSPELAPDLEFQKIERTSTSKLKKIYEMGKKAHLNFIYVWAPADQFAINDTICPQCKKVIVNRSGWQIKEVEVNQQGGCRFCQYPVGIVL